MKIVLFSGFPLDSSYNYTVNTNDWDTLVAQYYGMTREVLYDKISTSIEFNFIDRDSVHGSCTIDIATVTKIVKAGKTAKISTDYNYAIVYDNINNEYKHYFITGWDFVSSKKIGESFNNVYNVSFSLNLLAYFNVCETNNELPKNILVDRTHIWDNVSKYSSEGNFETTYLSSEDISGIKMFDNIPLKLNRRYYYIITSKPINSEYKSASTVEMCGDSMFYCYLLCDGYSSTTYVNKLYVNISYKNSNNEVVNATEPLSGLKTFLSYVNKGKFAVDDIVKIYVTSLPPTNYIENISLIDNKETITGLNSGISIQIDDYVNRLNLYPLEAYFPSNSLVYQRDFTDSRYNNKFYYYPFTKLQLVANNVIELDPRNKYFLSTALSPTKLGFIVSRSGYSDILGGSSDCEMLDCSNELPIATTAWLQYIAYNKNYYQMGVDIPRERANNATAGAILNMGGGLLGGLGRIAMGDVAGGVGGALDRVVSQMGNIAVSQMNADTTIKENQLQWDNIQNSPNKIKTLGTNIGMFTGYSDVKIVYLWIDLISQKSLKVKFYRSGYKYGTNVDTYAKLFVCTNFNYVKLGEPLFARYYGENLTDIQRDLLSEILSRGITYFEPSWFVTHGLDYPETNPYKETV